MKNQNEIVIETTHGRKSKCKTEFKAVLNKVLVSGVVLATLVGSTGSVFAAESGNVSMNNIESIVNQTQGYGISVQETFDSIRNTIKAIEDMRAKGTVSDELIAQLAKDIYSLQNKYQDGSTNIEEIEGILNEAEDAIDGLSNAEKAKTAIVVTRAVLGLDIQGNTQSKPQVKEETHSVKQAKAAPIVSSFPDVIQGQDWFFDNVMAMAKAGYINGFDDGKFHPNDDMSRAQFLMVVAKILNLDTTSGSDNWWEGAYLSAVDAGIITKGEMPLDKEVLNGAIPREEMALIAIRTMDKLGETVNVSYEGNVKASIKDFSQVSPYYKDFVLKAYSSGVITGYTDSTFKPQITLPRCQAAAVLNRIIDSSARVKQDFSQAVQTPSQNVSGPIEIIEGKIEKRRFAQEGDVVIKANGERYTLKVGPHGVLGEGMPVAADLGLETETGGNIRVVDGMVFSGDTDHKDAEGMSVKNQEYYVNQITGEGHFSSEWRLITSYPTTQGTFDLQLSADGYWYWIEEHQAWAEISVQNIGADFAAEILSANGLN